MGIPLFDRLVKRLAPGRHERRASLADWEKHHAEHVAEDARRVIEHLPQGGSFIDVGANLGLFSEALLAQRPDARGWLFEPVSDLYERCRARFEGNERIVIENFALSNEEGETTIWKARHNPGGNSLVYELMYDRRDVAEVTDKTVHDEETIRTRLFDDYAREHGIEQVDFIKTDTEGADYRVLEGMLSFIEGCDPKPVILSELMEEAYHPFWQEQLAVIERLYELGYQEVDLSAMKKIDDILFIPRK